MYHWNVYFLTFNIAPVVLCLDLKLVQVLCRHGDRAPLENSAKWYPTDPYINEKYEPGGYGGLTGEGRNRSFALGQFLRRKYFQQLNLSEYSESLFKARSSSSERCLLSAQAALLALFPDNQSIPIHYQRFSKDLLFLGVYICPLVGCSADKTLAEKTIQELDDTGNWNSLREYLSQHLGLNATRYHAFMLYDTLTAQRSMGLQLPTWTKKMYLSEELEITAAYEYLVQSYTWRLKRINGGMWIREFIKNMDDAASGKNSTKMLFYMGHEINIAGLLSVLDSFYPHVPSFGSCVIAELHRDFRNDQHYVRLFYKKPEGLAELYISGCSNPCSLVDLKILTRHLTLRDPFVECGLTVDEP
ncbi:venom acid phosphatase Acph-1-like [Diprion similis]|uniref:venom acid phosphatase Acph-1-like n=1 Tax=Diprion similis TaxID=362088 RepID=UPI001EF94DA7|nr:venom acid phosphatase Acph-1-like [Diprion similis]